ncbi:MAG TPA: hypothetical protein VEX37_06470 [Thermomicrobiales bacterium]|nr:hypothetical protein [Thermomicrobiales bacterium]
MASRDPGDAVARFVEHLRTITGCITQVPLTAQPTSAGTFQVIFHGGSPVELRTERDHPPILLSVVHHCRPGPHPTMRGRYSVTSTYYAYEILDLNEREILVYHWHPAGVSPATEPHLHLSPSIAPVMVPSTGRSLQPIALTDMHIPTGLMRMGDIVRVLIDDFKVRPLRRDWAAILARMYPSDVEATE